MADLFPFSRRQLRSIKAERSEEISEYGILAKMPLSKAGMAWLGSRRPFLSPRTQKDYHNYLGTIVKFFGDVQLEKLANPDLIRLYQRERNKTAGASIINHECTVIQQMLKRIRKWAAVAPFYQPVPLPRESPGRAMTSDEERRLFEAGALNPNWAVAYWAAMLSAHTASGPAEICGLRLADVFTSDPETARIHVHEHVKNVNRVREIPLNSEALTAAKALVERAQQIGATQPEHFLIPFRVCRGTFDPTRHGFWPRTAWNEMCAAAGVRLRPYDLRHHALTKLAETQPEHLVLKIAGHVSPRMLRKVYSHVRLPALRTAVNAISASGRENQLPERPGKRGTQKQAMKMIAAAADRLKVPLSTAMELLKEYEQGLGSGKVKNAS
ncbi:MAG TPA: tyrosine-type recombinase/integrase [Terriglobales bacterium]|nr:tyrosine-type recombinase/integrase [Terriglobales bacterium]